MNLVTFAVYKLKALVENAHLDKNLSYLIYIYIYQGSVSVEDQIIRVCFVNDVHVPGQAKKKGLSVLDFLFYFSPISQKILIILSLYGKIGLLKPCVLCKYKRSDDHFRGVRGAIISQRGYLHCNLHWTHSPQRSFSMTYLFKPTLISGSHKQGGENTIFQQPSLPYRI